jgi:hypothetical protein
VQIEGAEIDVAKESDQARPGCGNGLCQARALSRFQHVICANPRCCRKRVRHGLLFYCPECAEREFGDT